MMFVTVGAQMPFDRLIHAVDEWAGRSRTSNVFAQMGPTDYRPRHIKGVRFLHPLEFRDRVSAARTIVAHAGMGSILTALELGKPIIVMPRRGALGETRNDHQIATAEYFAREGRVIAAFTPEELFDALDTAQHLRPGGKIDHRASQPLIETIRLFVEDSQKRALVGTHAVREALALHRGNIGS